MKKIILILVFFSLLFGVKYTTKEKQFLKNNPVIYISAMTYWPLDGNGESIHTNYMKLLNKYGHLNLQPVFYRYWADGFSDAKQGVTYGIMALSYSKKRTKWFYYTRPYNYHPYYLVVQKNCDIKSMKDLKNKKVYIAKYSILREVLKNEPFKIVYSKDPYEKLADGQIDAILLFYMPNTKYLNQFKVIKTFINRAGEEHIGINKKYPELYSIIKKVMRIIPYSEIEKIRSLPYEKRIQTTEILQPQVELKDLVTPEDILLLVILLVGLTLILYYLKTKKFLNLTIKQFLISIFIFDVIVLGFILYEILIFNFYSNKILEIKSRSFNSLYLTDQIEKSVLDLDRSFKRAYNYKRDYINKLFDNNYIIASNLLVNNIPLKNLLNIKHFTDVELSSMAYIKTLLNELINIQQKILNHKLNKSIYIHKFSYLMGEFNNLRKIIKNENKKEIYIIKEKLRYQFLLLLFSIGLFIIESIFVFIMIRKKIYNPIEYLMNVIKHYKQNENVDKKIYHYTDEFGKLIDEFFELQEKLSQKIEELNQHKENLEKEIKTEVEKRIYQESILIKKSKMAMMGEMMDAIAHQWKQPLTSISLGMQILKLENSKITKAELDDMINSMYKQVEHMVKTLDEFRSFFRDDVKKETICIKNVVKAVLVLLKDEIMVNSIKIDTQININFCFKGIENDFEHLLITLLSNAKDIFKERGIKNKKIIIKTKEDEDFYYLEVIDNAKGVPEEIKDKIFDLNYTTRQNGTGVGLYLASQIAIKHNGILSVENTEDGANFYFKIKKSLKDINEQTID